MSQSQPTASSTEQLNENAKKQEAQSQESLKNPNITLRFMAAPTDVLIAGAQGISGGRVLEWIDKAAYAWPWRGSGRNSLPASAAPINSMRLLSRGHWWKFRFPLP